MIPHRHTLGCGCGMGDLVRPDRTIWGPGEIRAWLNQINEQIRSLDNDIHARAAQIRANADGPRFISDFNQLKEQWLSFNRTASSMWGSTVDDAQAYVNRYNALEARYRAITQSDPTRSSVLAPDEEPSTVRSVNYALMGWALIGIAGVVGVGYMLSNYAKVKTISKLALNRRRARGRRLVAKNRRRRS